MVEEAGLETEGMAETTSQLQAKLLALTDGKVNIMVDANNFKNTTEILREISAEWENLTDVERAATLELLGGKRQANILASIINNFDIVEDAIEASANSAGSAMEENEKVLDSIQGRINLFNNALQTMWNNELEGGLIKGVVNLGTELVKVVDTLGLIPTLLTVIAAKNIVPSLLMATTKTETFGAALKTLAFGAEHANNSIGEIIISTSKTTATAGKAIPRLIKTGHALGGLKGAASGAAAGFKGLWAAIPGVGKIMLITAAIGAVVAIVDSLTTSTKEAAEAAQEVLSAYDQARDTLNTHKKTIREISGDYEKLAHGVDDLGRNVSLSTDEYERYNEIANKIAEMFPEMVTGYTDEGNAIIALKGDVEELTKAYEEAASAARRELIDGGDAIFKTVKKAELGNTAQKEALDKLQSLNDEDSIREMARYFNDHIDKYGGKTGSVLEIEKILKDAGIEIRFGNLREDWFFKDDDVEYYLKDEIQSKLKSAILSVNKEFKTNDITSSSKAYSLLDAMLEENYTFTTLPDGVQESIKMISHQFDTEFYQQFEDKDEMFEYVLKNLVIPIQDADNMAEFTAIFDLQTQFNDGEISVDEYMNKITEFTELLKSLGFDEEIIKTIKGVFGVEDYETKKNSAMEILDSEGDSKVGTLSKTDLDIIDKNKTVWEEEFELDDNTLMSWEDLINAIQKVKDGMWEASVTFDEISEKIDSIQDAYSTLTDAVTQYNESGYLTLDSLQALLSLEPEYLALLQMENGQLSINQSAMETMIQTKLAEAKATAVQSAITQLNALAARTEADAINDSTNAANNAISGLGSYANSLGIVAQNAIGAAGAVGAFNAAVEGAQGNELVDQSEIDAIIANMNNQINLIDSVGANLGSNFKSIVSPGKSSNSSKDEDDAFQKEMDYWENRIGAEQSRFEQVQNEIDLLEKQGKVAGKDYYEEQINSENRRLSLLQQQKEEATKYLKTFDEGSENWWSAANQLNDIENEIDGVTASIQDLSDAMAEVDWYIFDEAHERINNLHDDLDTIRDLVAPNGEEDWFDDEGMWTDKGTAYLASYITDLQFYEGELESVNEKLKEHSLQYAGNEKYYKKLGIDSEQELYDKREELLDQQYEIREAQNDTQQSVADMYESQINVVEEYTSKLVDSYNDYIDVVKEALDAERELFELKKDIQKQTKDIVSLERRIASLSGSDSASDIAERRKLEAELYEAREGLDDTYYSHAKDAQSEALDQEAEAYEKSMNKFIESLRSSLDTALLDMEGFMGLVANAVTTNAPAIVEQYNGLGIALNSAIIDPWAEAANKITAFGGVDGLGIMNSWVTEGGAIYKFDTDATKLLKSPWEAGTTALNSFKGSVTTKMGEIYKDINSNVSSSLTDLKKLEGEIAKINDTNVKPIVDSTKTEGGKIPPPTTVSKKPTMSKQGTTAPNDKVYLQDYTIQAVDGKTYYKLQGRSNAYVADGSFTKAGKNKGWVYEGTYWYRPKYAKGTTGTPRDELAVVDEFGPELILHADPTTGRLQYLTKGSGVVPHDATVELMKLADLGLSGLMDANKFGANVNMISNAINKPELNITFDSLVKAENITEETIPAVRKLVTQELNRFTKELNYALKGKGAR